MLDYLGSDSNGALYGTRQVVSGGSTTYRPFALYGGTVTYLESSGGLQTGDQIKYVSTNGNMLTYNTADGYFSAYVNGAKGALPSGFSAKCINETGCVVGWKFVSSLSSSFVARPTTPGGTTYQLFNLGGLSGDDGGNGATSMNRYGDVVGYSRLLSNARSHAYVYIAGQKTAPLDLNLMIDNPVTGLTLSRANGINNKGQIIAVGYVGNNIPRAYLLTPNYS